MNQYYILPKTYVANELVKKKMFHSITETLEQRYSVGFPKDFFIPLSFFISNDCSTIIDL